MSPLTYIIREPLHNVTNHLCLKEWESYWDTQEEDGSGHSSSSSSSSSKCTYNTLMETPEDKNKNWVCMILMNLVLCGCCFSSNPASCLCVWFVCVSVHLHNTEIFQCFLSAREVARSRDRERASSSTGLGSGSVSRSGGGGGGEDDTILSQEGRRGSTGLPEGQDLYTAACNSVIHRCALLLLGVSPVLGELTKQNQEEGQTQSATGTQECLSFMTRSERCTPPHSLIKQHTKKEWQIKTTC